MDSVSDSEPSLLDVFLSTARHSTGGDSFVLKYRDEEWTYDDLDLISNGIAIDIQKQHGLHPVVASVSDNHPLVFAVILATWKIGGIFAPIDPHAPPQMIQGMLKNIEPTCVFVSEEKDADKLQQILGSSAKILSFSAGESTLALLMEKFLSTDRNLLASPPALSDIALYIHTSSAAGPWNLKCVPISHGMLSHSAHRKLQSMHQLCIDNSENVKVLGWAPWSHIIGLMCDIGASTLLTSGCYIFPMDRTKEDQSQVDVIECLLDTMVHERPDVFHTVPWVMDGFRKKYTQLLQESRAQEASSLRESLVSLKVLTSGGAIMSNETARWAQKNGVRVVTDLGMTETGLLFVRRLSQSAFSESPWLPPEQILTDATMRILDEDGTEAMEEGELEISSYHICEGYLKYDSSAFTKDADGRNVFKTGDIYKRSESGHLIWQGRKDDFIQMVSSETFDPRPIEAALDQSPSISRSCIVGNNYLSKPSEYLLAIIQPVSSDSSTAIQLNKNLEVIRAVAAINKLLPPPLRISWSRVLLLEEGQTIPCTRKRTVFRKKIELIFADKIAALERMALDVPKPYIESSVSSPDLPRLQQAAASVSLKSNHPSKWRVEEVFEEVVGILESVLLIDQTSLKENRQCTFAEFGMDSNGAIRIANSLNQTFHIDLPSNTCHRYIDLEMLHRAVVQALGLRKPENPEAALEQAPPTVLRPPLPSPNEDVVVVGQALRLPGNIDTPELFWGALLDKREDIMSTVPMDRWDHASFYRPSTSSSPSRPGDIYFEKAGFMDVAHFDNNFFGISVPEAKHMAPAIRLTLEVAFEVFENAGIPISSVKGSNMGVWTALGSAQGYADLLFLEQGYEAFSRFYGLGLAPSAACGRLSYLLDVHGPSLTVDTACSSSMVAFHQAVQYLGSGEGESAIVVAANTNLWPGSFSFLSAQKMASRHSRCATFTNEADGYVPSEGVGAIILKTMSAALRDNDNILATVRSTDIKHGGRSQGLVAPNVNVQIALQESLLQKAGLQPQEIDFLEAHGTGTSLGDAIEIEGISEVFQNSHHENPLVVGSAKTCIGHTEFAAGIVGIIKAICTLRHQSVPGSVHLREDNMNSSFDLGKVPLLVPTRTTTLPDKPENDSYYGLVLSNGFAGTIAGTVLASSPGPMIQSPPRRAYSTLTDGPFLFVLSAKSGRALKDYLQLYLGHCQVARPDELPAICYTTCTGREHYRHRFAAVVTSLEDLVQQLRSALAKVGRQNDTWAKKLLFAFPGQGCQYLGMAASLASAFPPLRQLLMSAADVAFERTGLPIAAYLMDKEASPHVPIQDPVVTQISIFVYQHALSVYLQTLGVYPAATLGHSLGEISAAVLSGALSFDVGLDLVVARARILRSDPSCPSGMAVVAASVDVIQDNIRQLGLSDKLVIAVYNSPQSHVISGEMLALDLFISRVKYNGHPVSKLKVGEGFHSPSIHSALPKLQRWLLSSEYLSTNLLLPLYSTAYGAMIPAGHDLKSTHWVQHAANPVRFSDAVDCVKISNELHIILDLGPQPFIRAALQGQVDPKLTVSCTTKPSGDQINAFLQALGQLFERGSVIDFVKLFPSGLRKISVPTYPYQRQRFYPTVIPSRGTLAKQAISAESSATLDTLVVFHVDPPMLELLDHHRIDSHRVVPAVALADFFMQSSPCRSLKSITFHAPLILDNAEHKAPGTVAEDGSFSLFAGGDGLDSVKITTGVLASTLPPGIPRIKRTSTQPSRVLNHQEIYGGFQHMAFGALFRNIQELRFYDSHAEASINVNSTSYSTIDRIQKLDACLHMFGAINQRGGKVLAVSKIAGGYLPTRLEDLTFHTKDLPDAFICRYKLPLSGSRDYAVMHTAFEVISPGGDLLVSCGKYSVAWVPTGLALQKDGRSASLLQTSTQNLANEAWLHQSWIAEQTPRKTSHVTAKIDHLYFVTPEGNIGKVYRALSALAHRSTIVHLPTKAPVGALFSQDLATQFDSGEATIVLNLTSLDQVPSDRNFVFVHQHVLALFQALTRYRGTITNFIAISAQSTPALSESNWTIDAPSRGPGIAAVIQGMLRVFRRETGLNDAVWSLDLPPLTSFTDTDLNYLISGEVLSKMQGLSRNRSVSYRMDDILGVVRLVPRLQYVVQPPSSGTLGGVCVVVGMGDIGAALAPSLLLDGCSAVVFIGRRFKDDISVVDTLRILQEKTRGRCGYIQADVCDFAPLSIAMDDIQRSFGQVEHVIHTAVALKDASIQNTDPEAFEAVLRPKVIGAWNLHLVSQDKCPSLKSFVLLSSISVTLENEGQIAYVAGNFYMETLAVQRVASGLPALCLQIGPWSSSKAVKSIQKADGLVLGLDDTEGVSLILKAMKFSLEKKGYLSPVQLMAKIDIARLAAFGPLKDDPLFSELIQAASLVDITKSLSHDQTLRSPKNLLQNGEMAISIDRDICANILKILGEVLELPPSEALETSNSLVSAGFDSISFAQVRGRVVQEHNVEIPVKFMGESFTVKDLLQFVEAKYRNEP